MLQDKPKFAYVKDSNNNVLSLPPLTNCEETKMSSGSKNILIEITSTNSLEFCKQLMEQLFTEMLNNGIVSQDIAELDTLVGEVADLNLNNNNQDSKTTSDQDDNSTTATNTRQLRHKLILQQVKIVDMKGGLKCVYPSRVDLTFNDSIKYQVTRLYND